MPLWAARIVRMRNTGIQNVLNGKLHERRYMGRPRLSYEDVGIDFSLLLDLTFRHRASFIYDRRFVALQRMLFVYLINKYISLSDICLTAHHLYK
jgi:hypothetical protein